MVVFQHWPAIRDVLVNATFLPPRDEHLVTLERWIVHRLPEVRNGRDRKVLRSFATWHHLRRLRTRSRAAGRTEINAVITLLNWLHQRDRYLARCAPTSPSSRCAHCSAPRPADHSTVGIVLVATSLLIMAFLSAAQRRAGRELGSASAVVESKQTLLCTYLSGVLLVGLLVNSLFGWTLADPIVALAIAAVAVKEGRNAWHGKHCC